MWLFSCVCVRCVRTCMSVCVCWWVYSSRLLWLVGTGLWFGSWLRARVRVVEHHGCHTATDILAPLSQYKFLFPKYGTTALCVSVGVWEVVCVLTIIRLSDCLCGFQYLCLAVMGILTVTV